MALHGIHIKASHKGLFHKDVGKKAGEKITSSDIQKGLHSKSGAERKRANFARNARKWNKGKGPKRSSERANRMYGTK
jgi:hypothetical protein